MRYTLFALLLIGCACPEPTTRTVTEFRIDTVRVTLPGDTEFDTVFVNNGAGESVKYIVRIDTARVFIKGKERIVEVPVHDTVQVITTVEKEREFFDITLKEAMLFLLGIAFLGVIAQYFRK